MFKKLNGYSILKNTEDKSYPYGFDDRIIPFIIFNYFEAPTTPLLKDELLYVMKELSHIYSKSFGRGFKPNEFVVNYWPHKYINFLSDDHEEIERVFNYLKSRPEIDSVINNYGFDKNIKAGLVHKPLHFHFFMINTIIERFSTSPLGSINYNYNRLTLKYRKMSHYNLIRQMKKFDYYDLMRLSDQIEKSRLESISFWEEYNEFWGKFAYDEVFSPFEYARALGEVYKHHYVNRRNKIVLLRLSRTDLLGSYDGIEGVYYFLFGLDRCIRKGANPKALDPWMLEGLRMYGNHKVIELFCLKNSIVLF